MNKKILVAVILVIIGILATVFLILKKEKVLVLTDKNEYQSGQVLKVNIRNNSKENICFSTCNNYYLERKDETWQSYKYEKCQKPDLAGFCIKPGGIKAFELDLLKDIEVLKQHRLAIPICFDCQEGEGFKESKRLYSNQFLIK